MRHASKACVDVCGCNRTSIKACDNNNFWYNRPLTTDDNINNNDHNDSDNNNHNYNSSNNNDDDNNNNNMCADTEAPGLVYRHVVKLLGKREKEREAF